jgi:excisionase family DNA binding protein
VKEGSNLLDISETADLLRLKESTIRSWILKRRIPFVRLGRRVFVRRTDCDRLIDQSIVAPIAPVSADIQN